MLKRISSQALAVLLLGLFVVTTVVAPVMGRVAHSLEVSAALFPR